MTPADFVGGHGGVFSAPGIPRSRGRRASWSVSGSWGSQREPQLEGPGARGEGRSRRGG